MKPSRMKTFLSRAGRAGFLSALLLAGGTGAVQGQDSWSPLGPVGEVGNAGVGGRVISLAVDPRNPNHVFAGSASGGPWVSELYNPKGGAASVPSAGPESARTANWRDPGRPYWRWRYVDTGHPVLGVGANDDHLVIATAPRYDRMNVFRSEDAGTRWQRITYNLPANGYPMSLLYIPQAEGATFYLTLGGYGFSHVWKLDLAAGKPQEWQDLDGGRLPDVWASGLVVDPADANARHLYVATDQGVYRTADGGQSWEAWSEGLYPGVLSVELLLFQPERLLRLVTHGNGIWQRRLP